jgi:L-methionine (R)-S-oxide reductase
MAEELIIQGTTKEEKYKGLIPQLQSLLGGETNRIANLANTCAVLKEVFGFFWVGFYMVENKELILGPFQGSIACTRIQKGRGVCGTVWENGHALIVPDVDQFEGHIACSSLSKSEIVIPLIQNEEVIGVLDIDSDKLNDFDKIDELYLTQICQWLSDSVL